MAKKDNDLGFYTDARISVAERIEEGKTKFFRKIIPAQKHAEQTRSYCYPIFNWRKEIVGYGVPK